jgi:hypothetical protein
MARRPFQVSANCTKPKRDWVASDMGEVLRSPRMVTIYCGTLTSPGYLEVFGFPELP